MHPVLFHVPGLDFPVRTFGALVACGILLGIWYWGRLLARFGDDPKEDPQRGSQVALWIVFGVIIGARLFYVVVESTRYLTADVSEAMAAYMGGQEPAQPLSSEELETVGRISIGRDFLHDPFQILLIWRGGLVMYGGMIGGILCGLWASRKHGLNPWNALDTALPMGFLGLVLGRWGCLFVGDDYGSVVKGSFTESWRPIRLPNGGEIGPLTVKVPDLEWLNTHKESLFDHDLAGQVLWATQPWMSLNALLLAAMGVLWLKRRRHYGVPAALLLMQYAVSRFVIEMFRGDEVRGVWFDGRISTSQIVSFGILAVGAWLFVQRRTTPAIEARVG